MVDPQSSAVVLCFLLYEPTQPLGRHHCSCLLCHHDLIKRKFWKYSHSTFICSLCGGKRNSSFDNVLLIQRLKTHSLQSILLTWCGRKQKCFLSIFMIIYCVNTLSWLHIYQKTRKLKFKAGFCRISYHCTMSVY